MWGVMVLSLDLREIQFLPSFIMPLVEYHTHLELKKTPFLLVMTFNLFRPGKNIFLWLVLI